MCKKNGYLKWQIDTVACFSASTIKRMWRMSQSYCLTRPLCFSTRNCRSLPSKIKLEQLGLDFKSYNVHFMALQKTRRNAESQTIKVPHSGGMLYTLNGGMGFVVSRRLQPYLQTLRTINNRVAVIYQCCYCVWTNISPLHI